MSEKTWRKSQLVFGFGLLAIVALAATRSRAVEESNSPARIGLAGIFPTTPPQDLSESEFAKLDGNWADWSKSAAATVADFYSRLESQNLEDQRHAIDQLKVKLDVMRRALDDPRYASLYGPLTALHSSLMLRIDLAEAILDTQQLDGSKLSAERLKTRANDVVAAIESLNSDLARIGNGTLWSTYFKVDGLKAAIQSDAQSPAALDAARQSLTLLDNRGSLDAEQQQFTRRAVFEVLATALRRYAAAAEWIHLPDSNGKFRGELKSLSDSLDAYLSTGEKAGDVRQAFSKVRLASLDDGERLGSALQKRLFNYNLRCFVSVEFLNRIMSQTRREVGPVVDFVMNANVSGCQVTDTAVSVMLLPSDRTARFALQLNGKIHSDTQGVTPQATVFTEGNHTFTATKEVEFDGLNFFTRPAAISVQPHNTTKGATTKLSGVPLLGRLANRIAVQQAEARGPESEAIAMSRVRDGVLPRFNQDVDASFAKEGARLNSELFAGLRSAGVFPDTYSYQTNERQLTVNARVMNNDQIGADLPETTLMRTSGATALVHETLVNNSVDHMGLAGQTLTEPELRAKIEDFITKITNRPFKIEAPPPADPDTEERGPNAIIFAAVDPLRVRIQDGGLTLIIRAGFKQEGKEDIPMREVTVPIAFTIKGSQIAIEAGNVVVAAAEGEGGGFSINAVVRKKIQSLLPDRLVDRNLVLQLPEKSVTVQVNELKFINGWASINLE